MTDYSIKRFNKYSDAELIAKLQDFAKRTGKSFVSGPAFYEDTGISEGTIINHFVTWQAFCEKAGLSPRYQREANRADLFENLALVWERLGRQPRAKEMKQPLSRISISRYSREFQISWYQICLEFLAFKSGASVSEIERESHVDKKSPNTLQPPRSTPRNVSLSLRYAVLKRDNFRCVKCGRSPALNPGLVLHVDHSKSWANHGETVLENLKALCSDCNFGKSNKHDD